MQLIHQFGGPPRSGWEIMFCSESCSPKLLHCLLQAIIETFFSTVKMLNDCFKYTSDEDYDSLLDASRV